MKVLPEPRQLSPSAHPTRISVHLIFHARPLDSVSRRSSVRGNRIHLRELCSCVHRYYSRSNLGQWSARSQHEWRELPLSFCPSLVPFLRWPRAVHEQHVYSPLENDDDALTRNRISRKTYNVLISIRTFYIIIIS